MINIIFRFKVADRQRSFNLSRINLACNMKSNRHRLLAVIGLATPSNCATAFVSTPQSKAVDVHRSSYPSTSVSLQHIDCNKRIGYPTRSGRNDCRSSSSISTSLSAIISLSTITTSISGFYKASPLLTGLIVGLVSRLTQYSSRKDTKLSSLNNKHSSKSNFAIIRVLCSGLVLGILFEIMIHGGIIFSICE